MSAIVPSPAARSAGDDRNEPHTARIWRWLETIADPEVPAVSIVDLGIVRDVGEESGPDGSVTVVTITPTYSGCPAMDMIAEQIESTLRNHGLERVRLVTRLSPPWTTEWMSPAGRERLRQYGIAPPAAQSVIAFDPARRIRVGDPDVECPRCGSANSELISEFGSTSCKAQYRCRDCLEPFDYFKSI
jgi:ring-1,2-phenylacetyl-CoA epoxidase subunit PaaD